MEPPAAAPESGALEIRMFGPFEVLRGDRPIERSAWGRRKTQDLLKFLLAHRGQGFTQDQLIEVLYPEPSAPGSLTRNLLGRVSELRRALEPELKRGTASTYILRVGPGRYAFNTEAPCTIDVVLFEEHVANGKAHQQDEEWASALAHYDSAVALYRGDFLLEDLYAEWAQPLRDKYQEALVTVLLDAGRCAFRLQQYADTLDYSERALQIDAYREDAYRHQMLAAYRLGQRQKALQAYDACVSALKELGLAPSDELRRLRRRVRSTVASNRTTSAPDRRASAPKSHNLPDEGGPLVGRTSLIASIDEILARKDCRCLTLLGSGGIGKTRLAVHTGHQLLERYQNGVVFVSMAGTSGEALLIPRLASALNYRFRQPNAAVDELLEHLRTRHMLLILDDAHEIPPGDETLDLLSQLPTVQILATSRTRLHLADEFILEVGGLSLPTGNHPHDLDQSEAATLFCRRLKQVNPSVDLQAADTEPIARICRLVAGNPLGLEMAAAWGRILLCSEIAEGMSQSLHFLDTEPGDNPQRYSLQAAFDHSWSLLSDDERSVFARLSVFRGGFEREAAVAVANAHISQLLALRDKAFLYRSASGRFEIHEVLRQFGEERLQANLATWREVRTQHATYYADLLAAAKPALFGSGQFEAFARLKLEDVNTQTAWLWAAETADAELLERMVMPLYRYYFLSTSWNPLRVWLDRAIEGYRPVHAAAPNHQSARLLSRLLTAQGAVHTELGHLATGRGLCEEGLELAKASADPTAIGEALCSLGRLLGILGDRAAAIDALTQSAERYRSTSDRWGLAHALAQLAVVRRFDGDPDASLDLLHESLALYQEEGDLTAIAGCHLNLGSVAGSLGRFDEAYLHFEASLATSRKLGDQKLMFLSIGNIGFVSYLQRDFTKSLRLMEEGLVIAQEIGHREGETNLIYLLGLCLMQLGRYHEALTRLDQALSISESTGITRLAAQILTGIGRTLWHSGHIKLGALIVYAGMEHAAMPESARANIAREVDQMESHVQPAIIEQARAKARSEGFERVCELAHKAAAEFPHLRHPHAGS